MIYTLVNTSFRISPSWSLFHQQLLLLRVKFQKNDDPENFIDRCLTQGRGKKTLVGGCEAQFCRQNILFLTVKVELIVLVDFIFL